jgi:phosphohistidine phosphatase
VRPATTPRTLVLVRHAKAEPAASTDFARELLPQGRQVAAAAGRWLASVIEVPQVALVSAAVRTTQTWEELSQAAGWEIGAVVDDALYEASPDTALDLIRAVSADVRLAVLVGHNPTVAMLAQLLDNGLGDREVAGQLATGCPTGTTIVLEFVGDWVEMSWSTAAVVAVYRRPG